MAVTVAEAGSVLFLHAVLFRLNWTHGLGFLSLAPIYSRVAGITDVFVCLFGFCWWAGGVFQTQAYAQALLPSECLLLLNSLRTCRIDVTHVHCRNQTADLRFSGLVFAGIARSALCPGCSGIYLC